jgi:hypothetical protein
MANASVFPSCFSDHNFWGDWQTECKNVPITAAMVSFLNLTKSKNSYFAAYCLNPPNDDSCPFGYCPQPDITGPLVRIASYITTLCLTILIFYSSADLRESYWASLLNIYSILLTSTISIAQRNLTRFHAIVAAVIVGSPLTMYNFAYATRSWYGHHHRLDRLFGQGQLKQRLLALLTVGLWAAFVIYLLLPRDVSRFAQSNCDKDSPLVKRVFLAPFILFDGAISEDKSLAAVMVAPFIVIILSWTAAIYLRKEALWNHSGVRKRPAFWVVWYMVGEEFPFVHFLSVVVVPFAYWCGTIELSASTANENEFSLSFGQVLALFVTIPPMVGVAKLVPRFGRWFINLAWVCWITRRPIPEYQPEWQNYAKPHKRQSALNAPLGDAPTHSRKQTYDDTWETKQEEAETGGGYVGYNAEHIPMSSPGVAGDARGRYAEVNSPTTYSNSRW